MCCFRYYYNYFYKPEKSYSYLVPFDQLIFLKFWVIYKLSFYYPPLPTNTHGKVKRLLHFENLNTQLSNIMVLQKCINANIHMMFGCRVMAWTKRQVILGQFLPLNSLGGLKTKI